MNFTESFDQFSSKLSGTDIALYAGAGLVLWVLFKDKLSPVQQLLNQLLSKVSNFKLPTKTTSGLVVDKEDVFFQLVTSWKRTRDLAVQCGCTQAVKVADDMFPFLSPMVCKDETAVTKEVTK